jgi:4-amino-4-deoxy-L-arabinose transferase-like glycosyltransferase
MKISTRFITCIFVLALLLRLGALAIFPPPPLDKSAELAYWGGAQILTHGNGFSDPAYPVYAPPFYAVFIATCLTLFGDDQIPIKIVQILLDSLTPVVVYLLVKEIFGQQTGILSAAILAIYPLSIYLSISIASEPLATFLLSVFMLLALYAIQYQKARYYCMAGVLLGFATLTRGVTQFFPFVFLIMLIAFAKMTKNIILRYGVFVVSFTIAIFPWMVRNHIVLDDFIPVGTAGGYVFLQGSTEVFFTSNALKEWPSYYDNLTSNNPSVPPKSAKPSEIDKFNAKAGMENYKYRLLNDPLSLVGFLVNKFLRLWYAGESGRNDAVILLVNVPIYIFSLAGLFLAWRRQIVLAWFLFSITAYFILAHWASLPLFRYMMPVMPYVIAFAAFAIISVFNELSSVKLKGAKGVSNNCRFTTTTEAHSAGSTIDDKSKVRNG